MRILLPMVVAAVPLLIAPHLLHYFDVTPKVLVLVFGAAAALIISIMDATPLENLMARRTGRWLFVLAVAQVISLTVSTIYSTNPALSLSGGTWRRFGFITQVSILALAVLAAGHLISERQALRPLLRAITITGGVIALYSILQYFNWDPFQPSSSYREGEGIWMIVRPPGTLGHASYLATYLLFPAFVGLAVFWGERHMFWKAAAMTVSVLSGFAIILSGTRAAIVGALAGGLMLLAWTRPRLRMPHFAAGACVAAVLIGFYFSPAGLELRARAKWAVDDVRGGARLPLWRDSLRMASERLWTGYGPEVFISDFPRFQSVELARAYPDFYHESPHNIFLDAFTSQGILGLLIAMGQAGLGFYAAARARSAQPAAAMVLGSCLAAVLISQQFTSFTAPNAMYYGLLVAMLVAMDPGSAASCKITRISSPPRAIIAAAGIAGFALFGIVLFLADYYLARVDANLENLNVSGAIQNYERMNRWKPAGFSADLYYSRKMAELAVKLPGTPDSSRSYAEALAAGVRATESAEDRQNAWYSLAELYAAQNDAPAVERSLRAAIASAPNWFKPHWTLAQVLRARGGLREAEAEASRAATLDGGKNPEVNRTLYEIQTAGHTGDQ